MRLQPMAPLGAAGRVGRGNAKAERILQPAAGPGTGSAFVLGRSLIVCTTLAAGIATAIVALGGNLDGVSPSYAATPVVATVQPPTFAARVAPSAPAEKAAIEAEEAFDMAARIDRVPPDFLAGEGFGDPTSGSDGSATSTGDPEQILTFGPMRIRRHLVETIMKAAKATEVDPVLLMAIADKESSFSTHVQARTSSATGLYQFIERTWLEVVREFGAKHGLPKEAEAINLVDGSFVVADSAERTRILELRRDPYLSALLAAEMLKRDRARISTAIGRELTHGETYLIHFLGPDDTERFLAKVTKNPKAVAAKLLPRPARANKPIFFTRVGRKTKGLSVAEVHEKFEAMMSPRLARYRDVEEVAGAPIVEASAQ